MRQSTPSAVVLTELGELPLWLRWLRRAARLWNCLLVEPPSSLLGRALGASVELARTAPGGQQLARQSWPCNALLPLPLRGYGNAGCSATFSNSVRRLRGKEPLSGRTTCNLCGGGHWIGPSMAGQRMWIGSVSGHAVRRWRSCAPARTGWQRRQGDGSSRGCRMSSVFAHTVGVELRMWRTCFLHARCMHLCGCGSSACFPRSTRCSHFWPSRQALWLTLLLSVGGHGWRRWILKLQANFFCMLIFPCLHFKLSFVLAGAHHGLPCHPLVILDKCSFWAVPCQGSVSAGILRLNGL